MHRNERSPSVTAATDGREACVVAECDDDGIVMLLSNDDLARARDVMGLARALPAAVTRADLRWPRD